MQLKDIKLVITGGSLRPKELRSSTVNLKSNKGCRHYLNFVGTKEEN